MIWCGVSFAYSSGLLIPIMVWHLELASKDHSDAREKQFLSQCFYAMTFFGIGQVLAGFVMGRIIDKIGSRRSCLINVILMASLTTTQFSAINGEKFNWLSHLNCFTWGLVDGCVTTHSLQIIGFEFADCMNPFAVFQLARGFAISLFQILEGNLVGRFLAKRGDKEYETNQFQFTIAIMTVGFISLILCFFFDFQHVETIDEKVKRVLAERRSSLLEVSMGSSHSDSYKGPASSHLDKNISQRMKYLKDHGMNIIASGTARNVRKSDGEASNSELDD